MWCPFCNHTDTRVVDSRLATDGFQVRRRRECAACGARFNTFETPALKAPNVIKSDGSREAFDEDKLRGGMLKALEKRPVETQEVERAIRKLLREVRTLEEAEISSERIGDWVAAELSRLDQVAYVRFASVYRRFEDVQAFREEIERLERENPGVIDRRQISLLDDSEA
ncbi:transcriptional repressor NrdR [Wenzhouxiangella sp. AB-CW3]|uniref:transcriptional regulator NrdR n=1 Tax=Wenzhouxiangella sp. AB-CW3 TaxID=2771012 RepID=UPI00168BE53F|nr:transcriptional regulator NrdR [Wenzhouxiangella sp. AB-CW3]QOC23409.1 transcriptional repressor NrdR [Wenzhouxiangella sp. AB-CW3]